MQREVSRSNSPRTRHPLTAVQEQPPHGRSQRVSFKDASKKKHPAIRKRPATEESGWAMEGEEGRKDGHTSAVSSGAVASAVIPPAARTVPSPSVVNPNSNRFCSMLAAVRHVPAFVSYLTPVGALCERRRKGCMWWARHRAAWSIATV